MLTALKLQFFSFQKPNFLKFLENVLITTSHVPVGSNAKVATFREPSWNQLTFSK